MVSLHASSSSDERVNTSIGSVHLEAWALGDLAAMTYESIWSVIYIHHAALTALLLFDLMVQQLQVHGGLWPCYLALLRYPSYNFCQHLIWASRAPCDGSTLTAAAYGVSYSPACTTRSSSSDRNIRMTTAHFQVDLHRAECSLLHSSGVNHEKPRRGHRACHYLLKLLWTWLHPAWTEICNLEKRTLAPIESGDLQPVSPMYSF
ncbi:hypothetical protein BD414DRAFT_74006 [Trametes punicea]|nr:hypothetical protein BD414DRAFT_74006 [Trametes punicea]